MTAHWLWFDGVEIANPARTRAYVNMQAPDVDTPLDCASCEPWVWPETFSGVAMDGAPWYDPAIPASQDFFGLWVTRTGGFDGSTRAANVVQLLGDGGAITGMRHEPREFRVTGVLVASSEAGLDMGSSWLSAVLERGREVTGCSGGSVLEWRIGCATTPTFTNDDPMNTNNGMRQARSVRCVAGPTVIGESVGALMYQTVEFTIVSPSPRVFLEERDQTFWTGDNQQVRRPGVTITSPAVKATCTPPADPPPIQSPVSNLPPLPPSAVSTPSHPAAGATYSMSKVVFLPGGMSPVWASTALRIVITAPMENAVTNVRVRVIEQVDPSETFATANPCNLAGEFFISYIPAGYMIEVDAAEQSITGYLPIGDYYEVHGTMPPLTSVQAAHLVSSSVPDQVFSYPVVTEGRAAWVAVDSSTSVGVTVAASTVLR